MKMVSFLSRISINFNLINLYYKTCLISSTYIYLLYSMNTTSQCLTPSLDSHPEGTPSEWRKPIPIQMQINILCTIQYCPACRCLTRINIGHKVYSFSIYTHKFFCYLHLSYFWFYHFSWCLCWFLHKYMLPSLFYCCCLNGHKLLKIF